MHSKLKIFEIQRRLGVRHDRHPYSFVHVTDARCYCHLVININYMVFASVLSCELFCGSSNVAHQDIPKDTSAQIRTKFQAYRRPRYWLVFRNRCCLWTLTGEIIIIESTEECREKRKGISGGLRRPGVRAVALGGISFTFAPWPFTGPSTVDRYSPSTPPSRPQRLRSASLLCFVLYVSADRSAQILLCPAVCILSFSLGLFSFLLLFDRSVTQFLFCESFSFIA